MRGLWKLGLVLVCAGLPLAEADAGWRPYYPSGYWSRPAGFWSGPAFASSHFAAPVMLATPATFSAGCYGGYGCSGGSGFMMASGGCFGTSGFAAYSFQPSYFSNYSSGFACQGGGNGAAVLSRLNAIEGRLTALEGKIDEVLRRLPGGTPTPPPDKPPPGNDGIPKKPPAGPFSPQARDPGGQLVPDARQAYQRAEEAHRANQKALEEIRVLMNQPRSPKPDKVAVPSP